MSNTNVKNAGLNEMYLPMLSTGDNESAANIPYAPAANDYVDAAAGAETGIDDTVVIGSPNTVRSPASISVYAESINSSGDYTNECEVCSFDVVFSVGINEGDVSKTYRVVKRIGLNKVKLANDAECGVPVSIVEEKTEAKKAAAAAQTKRFRQMAGLE